MANDPWFKLWASDYLTDSNVDKIPPEGRDLLLRMWCVCNLEGSAPAEVEELARVTRLKISYVSKWLSYLLNQQPGCSLNRPLFDLRNGRLYSPRMEREKEKSEIARKNAQVRVDKGKREAEIANSSANGSANSSAQKARKLESQKLGQDQSDGKRGSASTNKASERSSLDNSDAKLAMIAKLHPALEHLQDFEIPMATIHTIIAAVESETEFPGRPALSENEALRLVHRETKRIVSAYREQGKVKFIPGHEKFWLLRTYRRTTEDVSAPPTNVTKFPGGNAGSSDPIPRMNPAERMRQEMAEYDRQDAARKAREAVANG